MSHRERTFAQKHKVFLLRNLEKIRRLRRKASASPVEEKDGDYVKENAASKTGIKSIRFCLVHIVPNRELNVLNR